MGFSPLFFGVYGDTLVTNYLAHTRQDVSVPYFSGFMVIQGKVTKWIFSLTRFQSPYFRGLWWYPVSTTSHILGRMFQSPIFRGLWWYELSCPACRGYGYSFSPLFFGVYGDTRFRGDMGVPFKRFSPLFFGVYGDTLRSPPTHLLLCQCFSPLFSGFMVIRCRATKIGILFSSFSPLFFGVYGDT